MIVTNVSQPTMTVYSPTGTNTGVAMVVFPGGGYQVLAMDLEGTEICDWLNSMAYSIALRNAKVPVELHLYAEGGHAFGLRRTKFPITEWPQLVEKWLRTIRMTSE